MRILLLVASWSIIVCAQATCPTVQFPAPQSAALLPTPSTHRFLLKQPDGSFTAYEMSNTSPYSILRTIPHFDRQLSACAPISTDLATYYIISATPVPAGGYLVTYINEQTGGSYFDIFDASLNLTAESGPGIPATMFADLNGDGKLDAINIPNINHNAAISIALNSTGTTFLPAVVYQTQYPSIQSVLVADVNGDHKPDLIVIGFGSQIVVYLGNGDGTLQPPKVVARPAETGTMALADLNGDGILDLIYPDYSESGTAAFGLYVLLGVGDGTFGPPTVFPINGSGGLTIGDLNGDGRPDVFIGGQILFGDGKGAFPTQSSIGLGPLTTLDTYPPVQPIITDFNGDGIADLVFGFGNPSFIAGDTVTVFFGLGKGKFAAPPVTVASTILTGDDNLVEPMALASADFNGDGFPDIVLAQLNGAIVVMKGVGDGTFQNNFSFQFPNGIPWSIVTGDFNHDGKIDFAVLGSGYTATSSGGISMVLGNGDGTFQSPLEIAAPLGAYGLATADFNADGKPDLAVLTTQAATDVSQTTISESLTILLGNGDGTFKTASSYPAGPYSNSIVAGDFNGDGKPDLVFTNNGTYAQKYADATLVFMAGKGDGTFANPTQLPVLHGLNQEPYNVAAADFNGDGKLDLVVTLNPQSGGLIVLLGRGDGTFQTPSYYAGENSAVTVADLNGDGIPDLIVSGTTTSYLLGIGDGSFKSPVPVPGAINPLVLADLNHDGKLDIAASTGSGMVSLLNITPPSSLTVASAASLEPSPLALSSLATLFGKNLSGPVSITDSTGASSPATILYASPTQINFVVPDDLEAGPATFTVSSQTATIQIAAVQPSLFTLNNGGLAAAYVTRASPNGATYEPIFTQQNGVTTPVPIHVTTGQAYLVLFGTGLRNTIGARVSINGNFISPSYVGPQPAIPGLDQMNVPLPSSLAGGGYTNILLSEGSLTANPVYVVIK